MYQSKSGLVGTIIAVVLFLLLLWGVGSCTRVFFDPFSDDAQQSTSSSASSNA